jgi:hypothetical protein
VISVETCPSPPKPVQNLRFSTTVLHGENGSFMRELSVFPVVHTPYDFYERI